MTTRKKDAAPARPDGPMPDRGGAFYRKADGSLVRDRTAEQLIPKGEEAIVAAPAIPAAPVAAGEPQEG